MTLKNVIQGTPAETVFWWWKTWQTETTKLSMDAPNGQIEMCIPTETNFERLVRKNKSYEPVLEQALIEELESETVYYDVGSRWGYFTLFARNTIQNGEIHGFDANPRWYHLLKGNHESDDVNVNNVYVSDTSGDRTITLDSYCEQNSLPDVVKIDIEGAEAAAIRGMENTLETVHPTLFIEVHPELLRNFGDSAESLFDQLSPGYEIEVAIEHRSDENGWRPFDETELPQSGDYLIRAQ